MATQTVEFIAPTGRTITANLFNIGSDDIVASVLATESVNRIGLYNAVFTDIDADTYRIMGVESGELICSWWVDLLFETGVYLGCEIPASFIRAALGLNDNNLSEVLAAILASRVSVTLGPRSAVPCYR